MRHYTNLHLSYQYLTLYWWLIQVNAVRDGMATIIPVPLLSLVTPQHLEQLVCGMPHVSINVLKKVVRFLSFHVSQLNLKR